MNRLIDHNDYLVILRKDHGGSWKIARLMWHPMEHGLPAQP